MYQSKDPKDSVVNTILLVDYFSYYLFFINCFIVLLYVQYIIKITLACSTRSKSQMAEVQLLIGSL